MIVSHSRRFIFVQPAKVGGTSVCAALAEACNSEDHVENQANGWPHHTPGQIREKWPKEWEQYRRITVVRNPWDFAVSLAHVWYRYRFQGGCRPYRCPCGEEFPAPFRGKRTKTCPVCFKRRGVLMEDTPAVSREWLRNNFVWFTCGLAKPWSESRQWWNRWMQPGDMYYLTGRPPWWNKWSNEPFYFDEDGDVAYHDVLRFESLSEDYNRLGLGGRLPTLNLFEYRDRDFAQYHTKETIEIIAEKHAREIERFGYEAPA